MTRKLIWSGGLPPPASCRALFDIGPIGLISRTAKNRLVSGYSVILAAHPNVVRIGLVLFRLDLK